MAPNLDSILGIEVRALLFESSNCGVAEGRIPTIS